MQINEEVARVIAGGGRKLGGFTGAVPQGEVVTLEKGDIFTIPQNFEVLEENIRNSNNTVQFTMADCVSASGEKKVVRIFPTFFSKNRAVVNEATGIATGTREKCTGTAVDEYRKHTDVQAAMVSVAGKDIVVTDKKMIHIANRFNQGDGKSVQTPIFQLDFKA